MSISDRFTDCKSNSSDVARKKLKHTILDTVSIRIKTFSLPLISSATQLAVESINLYPYRRYTIGRNSKRCDYVFEDRRVSKKHCQVLFDAFYNKLYIADGEFVDSCCRDRVRFSLNGVFVNGVRVTCCEVVELRVGDEVSLVCGNDDGVCSVGRMIGFVVERVTLVEDVADTSVSSYTKNDICSTSSKECGGILSKADLLLRRCNNLLPEYDKMLGIQKRRSNFVCTNLEHNSYKNIICEDLQKEDRGRVNYKERTQSRCIISAKDTLNVTVGKCDPKCFDVNEELQKMRHSCVHPENGKADGKHAAVSIDCDVEMDARVLDSIVEDDNKCLCLPPPGNKFYLNRLQFMGQGSSEHENVVSLPELLYPVKTLVRLFITTFTSDISWFLSYCEIPTHLPVTIACHNSGKCWSSSPNDRMSIPYSNYPNLIIVYPPFPEAIAFGQDRKKLGIACHHPKLIVLQRKESIRVIITSANLVPKQWLFVTNTVWWQDFPLLSTPDNLSLFTQSTDGEVNQDARSDFVAQLAKFIASLVVDVPNQAHWIMELTKYDFRGAVAYLVTSVPGVYSPKIPYISDSRFYLSGPSYLSGSCGKKLLGSIEASVVGLSHLFRASADSSGSRIKKLAVFLRKCHENTYGMSEIVLKRNMNIPADENAIAVLIPKPDEFNEGDCIQLGFLPRNIAKWVAPLSDAGLFSFSAYIYRKDVLSSALEGSNKKLTLVLYVSQGPSFADMSGVTQPSVVSAICSLIAVIQRSSGLWRLQEVLGYYKWPETLETDFIFGSSSIGSVNAQFLAAFSAAAGKRSMQISESEESDPDWGCWSISQETRNPSIKIIYPTIERVKRARCGILASKYLLCFSEKTWLRLRNVGILHDAIPDPIERVGHPMHVKVGLRRFQSKTSASSCGWVYCGSHNFSAAAWGRPLSYKRPGGVGRINDVLGSRLHISNYEVGVVFIVPPPDALDHVNKSKANLDDLVLPFVIPAPKYKALDRPATAKAMREALAELSELEKQRYYHEEILEEEVSDEEEEVAEAADYVPVEKEEEKAYAEQLWIQVDSSQSC